ncbi:hypothetical protein HaLaN_00028 [Haematococcus lacustris]|uniref:Uncharacterized protein n=1 Tax=Haematococcus lacustris TaxID=44745 RepID=A0A699YCH5_HAELA|nr:hypothetical protein HaLaN_00028 [Haematococcus lacustris]
MQHHNKHELQSNERITLAIAATCAATYTAGPCHASTTTPGLAGLALAQLSGAWARADCTAADPASEEQREHVAESCLKLLPDVVHHVAIRGVARVAARRARRSGCAANTAATAALGRVFAPFPGKPRHSCRKTFLQLMAAWETGMCVYTGWSCRPSGSAT